MHDFILFYFILFIYSPLVLVLNGPLSDQADILYTLETTYLPSRLTILVYLIPPSSPEQGQFPVNKLRNLGIRNIATTHFQVLDMDLWPTPTTYETLKGLPREILENKRTAVILPVFFFDRKKMLLRCDSVRSCVLL